MKLLIQPNYILKILTPLFKIGIILMSLLSIDCYAGTLPLGDVANNANHMASSLSKMMESLSYVFGFSFAVGAILQYKDYRNSPSHVPLSKPVILFLIALILLFLPLFLSITGNTFTDSSSATINIEDSQNFS